LSATLLLCSHLAAAFERRTDGNAGAEAGKRGIMVKPFIYTLLALVLVVGLLGGIKGLQIQRMIAQGEQFAPPPETVTTAKVQLEEWASVITAVASLEAVQGIMVTAELSGKVKTINFESGQIVQAGALLLQQDVSSEKAQLKAAQATATLAETNLERTRQLLPERVVSQSDYDDAEAQFKQAAAQVENIEATIAKKTIRAPFSGRLGIRMVNLGQIINVGDTIVSLQALDPMHVNFSLPQRQLVHLQPGLTVRINGEILSDRTLDGKITAINPDVDSTTLNVRVQATVDNREERLRPGMFVNASVILPDPMRVLIIPSTAVLYAPYSNSVFVIETQQEGADGKVQNQTVRQQFVELGERRGDFVAVRSGLKEGQTVVSTGVFKLRSGQTVVEDNTLAPHFKLNPDPMHG
jgi:membrane fusion protein, multidrug efflux system